MNLIKLLKKNWKGALIGAISSYGLMVIIARIQLLEPLSILLLPGALIGGLLFKLIELIGLINSDGFGTLAIGIIFIAITNTLIFSVFGAYIQQNYMRRKK